MTDYLNYLEEWQHSKGKIFAAEGFTAAISKTSDFTKRSRYLGIESQRFLARATVWESGELDVEAIDRESGFDIVRKTFHVAGQWDLDDKLNWWLSEVATYQAS